MIEQFARRLQQMEEVVLAGAVLGIAALTILNVGCRSLLGFSLAFTEELSQFCIITICFVGLSYAASKARHIRMTAVYDQLSQQWRRVLMLFICSATAVLMFVLAWYAVVYVRTVYQLGGIYPVLRVPFFIVYSVAPLGLMLAGFQYLLAAYKNLASESVYLSHAVVDSTMSSQNDLGRSEESESNDPPSTAQDERNSAEEGPRFEGFQP